MIRMINVGVIGLGRQGMLHLMSCNKIEGVKVVAASDGNKNALKKAKSLGVEMLYEDYRNLFDHSSGIDAVVISLPNFLHMDCVRLALEAGLDVFIEKPLARNVGECSAIVELVEKTGKKLQVGNNLRFETGMQKMKEKADTGFIGSLEVITIEEIINGPFAHPRNPAPVADWWFDPEKSGGGVLLDLGCHLIDAFRFVVGEECAVEFSSLEHKFNLAVEDGAIVMLRSLNSSVRGIINVGWYQKTTYPQFDFNMVLHGSSGYLSINDFRPKNLYSHAIKEGTKNILRRLAGRKIRPMSFTYYYESFYDELVSFFDCINADSTPQVTATDGLRTVELIESAYKNSHSKII
jgi:predicted dehydrogenase